MAVETPQLSFQTYQPKDMAQAPPVQGPSLQQEQATAPNGLAFISKTGAAAYVANNILQGWLQGRAIKKQKELAKAQNQVQGADYTYQTMAQNYNSLLKSGKAEADPEVQKAKQSAVDAWHAKLNVMQQYAIPEDTGQKKSVGKKAEGILSNVFGKGGIQPEMIPQASLAVLRNAPPPGLGLSVDDQNAMKQSKLIDLQTQSAQQGIDENKLKIDAEKQTQARADQWTNLTTIPEGQRTPEQKQTLALLDKVMMGPQTPDNQLKYGIIDKIQAGTPLSDMERSLAYRDGLLTAPQTIQRVQGGQDVLQTIGPDGNILSTVKLGKHYEPDQVGPAVRLAHAQQQMMHDVYKKANPDVPDETIWGMVAADQSRNPQWVMSFIGQNPKQQELNNSIIDKALRGVMAEAGGPGVDAQTRANTQAQWSNFVVTPAENDKTGFYMFKSQLDPMGEVTHWFKPNEKQYAGGLDDTTIAAQQGAFYNRVRSEIMKQNPKLTPMQVDQIIPGWMSLPAGAPGAGSGGVPQGLTPTPGSGKTYGVQGPGTNTYSVVTTDGITSTVYMTPDMAAQMQQQGATVTQQ